MVAGKSSNGNDHELKEKPRFDNLRDEATYWKKIAEEHIQKLQDAKEEFDEYQDGSRELEAELETQLEQYEQKVTDLLSVKCKLEEEKEILKEKLETTERQTYIQIMQLQDENVQIKAVRDEMAKYIRGLEQSNDDLERTKRATITSLEEFDVRLSNAIERNVFLENELEEKEQLVITVQRLKDESRDLKGELAISSQERNSSLNESKLRLEETQINTIDMNTIPIDIKKPSPKVIDIVKEAERNKVCGTIESLSSKMAYMARNGNILPSSRISALNIVGDILQKVGAMESKLVRYRNLVQETSRIGKPP